MTAKEKELTAALKAILKEFTEVINEVDGECEESGSWMQSIRQAEKALGIPADKAYHHPYTEAKEAEYEYNFENVVFLQGNDPDTIEALDCLDKGEDEALQYLINTYYHSRHHELIKQHTPGETDTVYDNSHGFIMTYNQRFGYIGLVKRITER